jgi:hypothetical protein
MPAVVVGVAAAQPTQASYQPMPKLNDPKPVPDAELM